MPKLFFENRYLATLIIFIACLYYKFFLFGKIPFPGDLLVGSYLPWLDYYKIPVQNPLISDVFSQLILWKYLSIEAFRSLQWPLWNPYSFTGNPLLANYQSATLYPLNILLLLPKYLGWGLFIFSQTLIASLTFYLFTSQITQSKIARLIGSILFSLGSLMTTWVELGTAVHGMAWLPLSLYAIKKFSLTARIKFLLILTISLALITLSGATQITTYSYIITFFYSLYAGSFNLKKISLLFLAIITSIMITLPQLLPSYEFLGRSIRQSENYTSEYNHGLLSIKDSFKFFIADYFGNPVTRNYWGELNYFETSAFLGSLTLPILIYALFKLRNKESLFFASLFITSLLLIFDNPLSQIIYSIKMPLLTSSYASRGLFISLLSSSILATLALNHLINSRSLSFFLKTTLWSWATISGIILGTLLVYFYIQNTLSSAPSKLYLNTYLSSNEYNLKNFSITLKNSLVPLVILSFFLVFSFLISQIKQIKNKIFFVVFLVLFLSILDLSRYFLKFNPFISHNFIYPITPALDFLQKQPGLFRVGREHAEILPPNTWIAFNLYSYEGYDPVYLNRYGKFMHFLNGGDIRTGSATRYAELASNYSSIFLDAANTKYFVSILRDEKGQIPGDKLNYKFADTPYKEILRDKSTAILENPNSLDRAYFAKAVIESSSPEDIIMSDQSFDPRKTVLLSDDVSIGKVSGKGNIKIISYTPNKVILNTETSTDELLVLADQYEEGWQVKIDGIDTKISRANLIFRAVKVPAGTHEIKFSYWPKSFDVGLKISLATIGVIFIISFIAIKKKNF